MTFHPESLRLTGDLKARNDAVTERTVLYQGIFCLLEWRVFWLLDVGRRIFLFFFLETGKTK